MNQIWTSKKHKLSHIIPPPFIKLAYSNNYDIYKFLFQVASELNAAILKAEHADNTQPKLAVGLKCVLWSQNELDKKRIRYNRMVDLSSGRTEDSK